MLDLKFDIQTNDLVEEEGTLAETNLCSLQNATLIFFKSPASITQAQFGVGFESLYANLPSNTSRAVAARGERQVKEDGATVCSITFEYAGINKDYNVLIRAAYPQEQNALQG